MSEMRWNPLLGEWVVTATQRQDRTFFPPPDYDPLAPTRPGGFPTEVPEPDYEIVVFENKFPSFRKQPPAPSVAASDLEPVRPALGICEVVCYTPKANGELATMLPGKVEELVWVWADRFEELSARPFVEYVLIFENKGKEIGVTLPHPHCQIYAFSFVPPIAERELSQARAHWDGSGRSLFADIIASEMADGRRIVTQNEAFVAVVPFYARYPYEVHILPREQRAALTDFGPDEKRLLAEALQRVVTKYNNLWNRSLPYMMIMHQRPSRIRSEDCPYYRFHIEFYPPYRTPDKLKYLAGVEAGAGTFINDTHPEDTARALREAAPSE